MRIFNGIATAIITPFINEEIDFVSLKKIVNYQEENGIEVLVVNGTTAESPTLSLLEQIEIIEFILKIKSRNTKIIVGISENDTKKACVKAQKFSKLNINGLLVLTPFYNRTNDLGMKLHFEEILKNTELPIILYHIPARTGCRINYEVLESLSSKEQIVGIKYADADVSYGMKILHNLVNENFAFYSGNDDLTYLFLTLGAQGSISASANVFPFEQNEMYNFVLQNNYQEALKIHNNFLELNEALFLETNPILIKYALSLLNFNANSFRLPLCEGSKMNKVIVKSLMHEAGIL